MSLIFETVMTKVSLLFLFVVVPTLCFSQDNDEFASQPIDGAPLFRKVTYKEKEYFVCEVDPAKYKIELFNILDSKNREHTFRAIDSVKGKKLVLIVNGGMFQEDLRPLGLYISGGRTYYKAKRDTTGYGNFYMQPNGIFMIDGKSKASVIRTKTYSPTTHKPVIATQSGPMLVTKGVINKNFREGSTNLNIRNGVGVNSKGLVVLVTSEDYVNFYEFAKLYREQLDCENALYLDGVVSQYYAPALQDDVRQRMALGVFIVVGEK